MSFPSFRLNALNCRQHQELGRRPYQPAPPGQGGSRKRMWPFKGQPIERASTLPRNGGFLFVQSELDASLINAYLETEYRVTQAHPLVLRVDVPSPELASLYKAKGASCAAFITACNPFSCELSDADNAKRQAELAAELKRRSLSFFEGVGQHPSGDWPGEPSFLVLGLALEAAKSLGKAYEQNAVIWCGPDAVPSLVLLR